MISFCRERMTEDSARNRHQERRVGARKQCPERRAGREGPDAKKQLQSGEQSCIMLSIWVYERNGDS